MQHSIQRNTGRWVTPGMALLIAALVLLLTPGLRAQQDNANTAAPTSTTTQKETQKDTQKDTNAKAAPQDQSKAAPSSEADHDDAAKVMDALVQQMKKNPLIEPTDAPASKKTGTVANPDKTPGYQPVRVGVDPNIVGTAPGVKGKAPKLRREGEFIISRKGRLVRSDDGLHTLFIFDADSKKSPEAPMAMVPCQMLQSMEDLVGQRGDQIQFIVSGQILVYRGVNYLLPTMMTLAQDRGNLQ